MIIRSIEYRQPRSPRHTKSVSRREIIEAFEHAPTWQSPSGFPRPDRKFVDTQKLAQLVRGEALLCLRVESNSGIETGLSTIGS